jgi:phenylalanyl-tRNA synthetase beta chain
VRVPLSWLTDFAPFQGDPADLAAALDDLGLVVEGTERVGEDLDDVVVVRVDEIAAIEGADKIRRVVVDDGAGPVEVVCGAWNFEVGDLVPLAPVGAVLPGGVTMARRTMRGVVSNGMLCSGRELRISEDHEGILRLNDVPGAAPGVRLTVALGLEPDTVFDVAVEANRPDAWSMVGVARDLAARMRLPFAVPEPPLVGADHSPGSGGAVTELADVRVDDLELCPRFTARVLTGVKVGPSPEWLARRLVLAGMRPINNVVDASNYVMLEMGQPTHPYDLDRLNGHGLLVRRARPGETVTTLDGVERTLGRPGPGLGDSGQDCLICDAGGAPVAIGGVMGGASSEIDPTTTRVLLEAAYFVPMAIARTSKRLALRTEASARFERGCDPAGIDRAAARFCQLLSLSAGPDLRVADGVIDVVGELPQPVELTVRPTKINALLGTSFTAPEVADLLAPLGITASPTVVDGDDALDVTVPTYRPDIRAAPMGEADIAEEVARTYGYVRIARHTPSWPQPGRLTDRQRDRRLLKEVLCGLGGSEAWTATFLSEADQQSSGADGPYVEVTNPLVEAELYLRTTMVAGLVRSVRYNIERRQSGVRLFEVGSVFRPAGVTSSGGADEGESGHGGGMAETSERLSVILAADGDDAWTAVGAWRAVAEALGIESWSMEVLAEAGWAADAVHPYRSSALVGGGGTEADGAVGFADAGGPGHPGGPVVLGVVGELDPSVVARFDLVGTDGRPRRVGWLDLDLGVLLDRQRVDRRPARSRPLSRFPSSDIDLAFVVRDSEPAGSVERTLRRAGGELLESVELFDVYRGVSLPEASRSLAFHLRFCALDRTLTDEEIGALRAGCIEAVEGQYQASLR